MVLQNSWNQDEEIEQRALRGFTSDVQVPRYGNPIGLFKEGAFPCYQRHDNLYINPLVMVEETDLDKPSLII